MQSGPAQSSAGPSSSSIDDAEAHIESPPGDFPDSDSDGWPAVSSESDPADDPTDQADLFQSQGKGAQTNAS